ncbi:MAG: chemotaxis protein CheD [Pseudomonadota bacterium]
MRAGEKTVTIVQGDYAVSADPAVVMSTVLGSCVSVCLFDAGAGVGGMNHFLLAMASETNADDLKYGVNAMELLINEVLRSGGRRAHLQAKLFGGARMNTNLNDIGASNARFAQEFLSRESIPCLSQSLGSTMARRVRFTPTTGAAQQMQIAGPAPELLPVKRKTPPPEEAIMLF